MYERVHLKFEILNKLFMWRLWWDYKGKIPRNP